MWKGQICLCPGGLEREEERVGGEEEARGKLVSSRANLWHTSVNCSLLPVSTTTHCNTFIGFSHLRSEPRVEHTLPACQLTAKPSTRGPSEDVSDQCRTLAENSYENRTMRPTSPSRYCLTPFSASIFSHKVF